MEVVAYLVHKDGSELQKWLSEHQLRIIIFKKQIEILGKNPNTIRGGLYNRRQFEIRSKVNIFILLVRVANRKNENLKNEFLLNRLIFLLS